MQTFCSLVQEEFSEQLKPILDEDIVQEFVKYGHDTRTIFANFKDYIRKGPSFRGRGRMVDHGNGYSEHLRLELERN